MLDFIQSTERKTKKLRSRVDFVQRRTAISAEMSETASPDWTKSTEAQGFRENAGFDWTKSTVAPPHRASR
ncbi:hypothetical protein [Cohnella algarum]|uniref:hypothetical protein n=1 Tax=Cohnella algarum TaxID=2044859 RepID=UPI0019673779|nr:hypothetical protein [Cohnella algarum]MBN2981059.1 hypothetical protein [Cohnella algarum]